ncbi:MAG: DUF2155 domain-containing protein [Nitrospirae bacterium]|nr:DUF2155 domain-containing protein [Nitrospirota bacterium]
MNKKFLVVALSVALSVILVGSFACKKKEEPVPQAPGMGAPGMGALPPGHPIPGGGQGAPGGVVMPKGDLQVIVPANVKGKWSAVKIVIEDKVSKKTQEYAVKLNSELKIPNSDLKISVGEFMPDFRMDANTITSATNNPNNPAVSIKVFEGNNEIFKGWLYSKFPAIHPFEHPKVGLTLKEGVKKG